MPHQRADRLLLAQRALLNQERSRLSRRSQQLRPSHPSHSTGATSIGRFWRHASSGMRNEAPDTPGRRSARRRGTSRTSRGELWVAADPPTSLRALCLLPCAFVPFLYILSSVGRPSVVRPSSSTRSVSEQRRRRESMVASSGALSTGHWSKNEANEPARS